MVTIALQQIIVRPQKAIAHLTYDSVDFFFSSESEALQDRSSECAAGWFETGRGPVDAREVSAVVPAVGVFAVVDYDARVEEGGAEAPEEGGEAAGLC